MRRGVVEIPSEAGIRGRNIAVVFMGRLGAAGKSINSGRPFQRTSREPSPTSTNGAQYAGWASLLRSSIIETIAARTASARWRPLHLRGPERPAHQRDGGSAVDIPVRYEQRARASIDERAGKPGERLRICFGTSSRIAGGKQHEIGIESQSGNLGRRNAPSSCFVATVGGERINPGSLLPTISPPMAP